MSTEISVPQGNTRTLAITYTDNDEIAIDITGWTVIFMVKTTYSDVDASALITKTASISTPTAGIASVSLTTADTSLAVGNYVFDVKATTTNGQVYTAPVGNFKITKVVNL